MRAVQRSCDLRDALLCARTADRGPRTRAQPLGDLRPQLDTPFGRRGVERLRVGVGDYEIDALDARRDHVCDGLAARAADPAHRVARLPLVDLRRTHIEAHPIVSLQRRTGAASPTRQTAGWGKR